MKIIIIIIAAEILAFVQRKYFCASQCQRECTMSFQMKEVHIGELIKKELQRQHKSTNWLAQRICCEQSNVYKMFKRKSLDVEKLMQISVLLNHNFLKDCYIEKNK